MKVIAEHLELLKFARYFFFDISLYDDENFPYKAMPTRFRGHYSVALLLYYVNLFFICKSKLAG